jgi:hypothetical protein
MASLATFAVEIPKSATAVPAIDPAVTEIFAIGIALLPNKPKLLALNKLAIVRLFVSDELESTNAILSPVARLSPNAGSCEIFRSAILRR